MWDAKLYDDKFNYVSGFGKGVIELLNPQSGERILDLGCGTGDLTGLIAKTGAVPVGIDLSPAMVEKARQKYPHISFAVENGENFRTTEQFDAVFSNAALHWMKKASKVVESVWLALRPAGRFVAEFGGKGNVETILLGISDVLAEYGIFASELNPWYYPSIGEYSTLLEEQGFRVTYAVHFDRQTPLAGKEDGLKHILDMFCGSFFLEFSSSQKEIIYKKVEDRLISLLFRDGTWIADYKRLRVMAVKE